MTPAFRRLFVARPPFRIWLIAIAAALASPFPLAAQPGPFGPLPRRGFRPPSRTVPPPVGAPIVEEEIEDAARVAFLNLDRSPLGALVEAKLRDKKMVNWWPRSATGRLLAEVELNPGLDLPAAPDPKNDKSALPDAIILVRTLARGDVRQAEVVVCEPGLGLRLGAQRVTLTGEVAKDVDSLVGAATSGLKKLGESMRQLWAVPPFRNQDLTQADDDLRQSLGREAEQALLSRQGAFAVELNYSYVITAARRFAGIEQGVSRPTPRFVLGEYRHERKGDSAVLALTLAVQENETPGQQRQLSAAAPQEAIKALRSQVAEVAKSTGDGTLSRDDGSDEKNLIAAVFRAYQKDGNWQAALGLCEARLLLDPTDRKTRADAVSMAVKLTREQGEEARRLGPPPDASGTAVPAAPVASPKPPPRLSTEYVQAMVLSLNTYRRAMGHVEWLLATTPPPDPRGTYTWLPTPAHEFAYAQPSFTAALEQSPGLAALCQRIRRQRQEVMLRFNERSAANGEPGDMLVFSELSPEERQALVLRMIVEFRNYPRAEMRNQSYIGAAINYGSDQKNTEQFLAQVSTLGDATVQKAVEQQRQRLARTPPPTRPMPTTKSPAAAETKPETPDPDAQVVFTPLSLPWKNVPDTADSRTSCELCLPLGKDADLFAYRGQILLAKKKGDYKLIWEGTPNQMFRHMTSAGYGPSLACYDGKLAWVPLVDPGKPARLLVIDPATEKVTEVTAKDGLPEDTSAGAGNPLLAAAPLSPGKVFLAGSFGRSWLGIATFDPEKGGSVKVIHQARDLPVAGERDQHQSATLAFDPTYLFPLSGKSEDGKPIERVLVGRYVSSTSASQYPLAVDPDSGKVEVMGTPLTTSGEARMMLHDGSVYWTTSWYQGAAGGQEIWRLSLPNLKPQSLGRKSLASRSNYVGLAMEEKKVHLLQQQWHTAASWDETLAPLRGKVPGQESEWRQPLRSALHGWLLHNANQSRVYAVEFKEEAAEKRR